MEEKMNEEQSMEDGQREEDDIDYVEDREGSESVRSYERG